MKNSNDFFKHWYGMDALSVGFLLLSLVLDLIVFTRGENAKYWAILSIFLLALCILRILSKNHAARMWENQLFLKWIEPLMPDNEKRMRKKMARWNKKADKKIAKQLERKTAKAQKEKEKEEKRLYKFFNCPSCDQSIRVPKGKGRVEITCPKCRTRFIKKT